METLEHGAANLWITDSLITERHFPFLRGPTSGGRGLARQTHAVLGITVDGAGTEKCGCTKLLLICVLKAARRPALLQGWRRW